MNGHVRSRRSGTTRQYERFAEAARRSSTRPELDPDHVVGRVEQALALVAAGA